jgi:autotransporter-associated beta strand protein/T5SS/PEP-CTERM-associated repeat protein
MKQQHRTLIALVEALCAFGLASAQAEDYTTNIVTTSVNNGAADYYVGNTGNTNYLEIKNGGQLFNVKDAYIGNAATATFNSALVTDSSSLLGANNRVYVGNSGKSNVLTVANGASVVATAQVLFGFNPGSDGNRGLVTGTGSVLQANGVNQVVGRAGSYNSLTISNGGTVVTTAGGTSGNFAIGAVTGGGSNNWVLVTGTNSACNASGQLILGAQAGCSFNSLIITNGGGVTAQKDIFLGNNATAANNSVLVTGAGSGLTNNLLTSCYVGITGPSNSLTVANGARLETWSPFALGYSATANYNSMQVTGTGSAWSSAGTVTVGYGGSGNNLTIDGGAVATLMANFAIGTASTANNNWTLVTGANSVLDIAGWASIGQEFSGGSGTSLTVASGGILKATQVIIPVSTARLILNGGTLQAQADSTGFIVGSSTPATTGKALIQSAGATIDSSTYTIRPWLPLEEDATSPGGGLTKTGTGTLELAATNTYTGPTTVEAGTFGGNCSLLTSSLLIKSGATLAPGAQGIGRLAVAGGVTNQAGSTTILQITSDTNARDEVVSSNNIALSGSLLVTNLGTAPFTNGQEFVFYQSLVGISGNFTATNLPSLSDPSLTWKWTLTPVNLPTTSVATLALSVVALVPSTPTNITCTVSGTNLDLTWPGSYLGWYVQSNAVSLTSPGSWFDIPNSQAVTNLTIPIDPALPQVYYRMRYPQ